MTAAKDIYSWESVPARVAELLPAAARVRVAHEKAAVAADILHLASATWEPESNKITVHTAAEVSDAAATKYANCFEQTVVFQDPSDWAPDWEREILIKSAAIPGVKQFFELGNKALGGPTPLSNGLVSSLLLGGLGYGTGALAEQLFPERYMRRGRLRKTLGLLGAGTGLGVGAVNAYANARALKQPYLKSLVTKNDTPVVYPFEKDSYVTNYGFNPTNPMVPDAIGMDQPTISVPQFNTALWRDVHKGMINPYGPFGQHTPPPIAAAATGMMSGISTGLQSPVIRPSDVVRGFASAGVGLATANIAGRALSALAGLTPEAQNKLQDLGLWGGMMHAVMPPLFRGY